MEEYWQQLAGLIVAPTLVVAAVAWILKTVISQGFARDIQHYKSELDRANFEHQQRFSTIHQRQAEVIANLYGKIAKSKSSAADLVGIFQQGSQPLTEKKKRTAEIYNDMSAYFYQNRIFLPNDAADKAETLIGTLRDVLIEFDTAQMGNEEYKSDETGLWMQSYKRLREEVPPVLNELGSEFKKLLGVIESDS
ncbi:hypothetical protein [Halomonas sp. TD01]|uniref:hypothetical protein n=1 Tax=Halomonas sp. TD01 TaxID=999141 RepID=UPI000214F602|nr:hypothetical protein [Halomonas sp. TD01]EGP18364.1 hypothetical protein GME_16877 [Halomonas sp. TD01]CAH1044327.1 hypothetical protein HPTD01_2805 [Halomonas sp. TD01]